MLQNAKCQLQYLRTCVISVRIADRCGASPDTKVCEAEVGNCAPDGNSIINEALHILIGRHDAPRTAP